MHWNDFDTKGRGFLADSYPGGALGRIGASPNLGRMEVFDECRDATDVVFVGMGGNNDVDVADGPAPEIGRDYVFADIHFRL